MLFVPQLKTIMYIMHMFSSPLLAMISLYNQGVNLVGVNPAMQLRA